MCWQGCAFDNSDLLQLRAGMMLINHTLYSFVANENSPYIYFSYLLWPNLWYSWKSLRGIRVINEPK